jgi:hypothetical protein
LCLTVCSPHTPRKRRSIKAQMTHQIQEGLMVLVSPKFPGRP